MLGNGVLPGVVGCEYELEITGIAPVKVAQIGGAAGNVLPRVGAIPDAVPLSGGRHELHQTDRALARHGVRPIGGLRADHRVQEVRSDTV